VPAGAAGKFTGAAIISKSLAAIVAAVTAVAGATGLGSTLHSARHSLLAVQTSTAPAA